MFHYSVRKRSADALNRVRSQAKLKDATKRIGFLSRYKLLYHSHFLKLFHQKYKCIWNYFLFKIFIKYTISDNFDSYYFRLGIVGANRPGEKTERSRKDRKERKKRRKKKKDDDRRPDSKALQFFYWWPGTSRTA